MADKTYHVNLDFDVDTSALKKAGEAIDGVRNKSKGISASVQPAAQSYSLLAQKANELAAASVRVGAAGAGITIPLKAAVDSYASAASYTEETSRSWLLASQQLSFSYTRAGKAITSALLPSMETAVQLANKGVAIIEKYPDVVKGIAGLGIVMGGIGAAGAVISQVQRTVSALQWLANVMKIGAVASAAGRGGVAGASLISRLGFYGVPGGGIGPATLGQAAGTATLGSVLGVVGSVVGGVAGGFGLNEILANITKERKFTTPLGSLIEKISGRPAEGIGTSVEFVKFNKYLTVGAFEFGKLLETVQGLGINVGASAEKTQRFASAVANATGAINDSRLGRAGVSAGTDQGNQLLNVLQMQRNYIRQSEEAQRAYDIQRIRMDRDFNRQLSYSDADYQMSRYRQQRDFNKQIEYADADFYRQRAIAQRDFGIQWVRGEIDYQRQRTRAQQDHQFELFQIALSGDAMQYWLSERQYNISRNREQEDFDISRQRQQEDFDRSRADQEREFQIQRERQLYQFDLQRNDAAYDFNLSRSRQLAQYAIQISDMEFNFKEQKRLRDQALQDAISSAASPERQLAALRKQLGDEAIADFQRLIDATRIWGDTINSIPLPGQIGSTDTGFSSSTDNISEDTYQGVSTNQSQILADYLRQMGYITQTHQAGGYTYQGLSYVHDNEFVLNPNTTKAAESVAKGRLTQDKVLQMLAGGGGSVTYNDHRTFDSSIPESDRLAIMRDTQAALMNAIPG